MDVKTPPLISSAVPAATASAPELGSRSPASVAAALDRADIRPLDIPAALQILLAEVRAAFELTALDSMTAETSLLAETSQPAETSILADSPPQTARAILQLFLRALPQDTEPVSSWAAALTRAETTLQQGLDRGIAAINGWNEVPAMVLDAAKETHALIFSALADDSQNPIWLRPEWAGLAPRLDRFWRRRRLARRRVTDPDYPEGSFDDDKDHRR